MYSLESDAALITDAMIISSSTMVAIPAIIREERTGLYARRFSADPRPLSFLDSKVVTFAEASQMALFIEATVSAILNPVEDECLPLTE